jgi:hypothetical protein
MLIVIVRIRHAPVQGALVTGARVLTGKSDLQNFVTRVRIQLQAFLLVATIAIDKLHLINDLQRG